MSSIFISLFFNNFSISIDRLLLLLVPFINKQGTFSCFFARQMSSWIAIRQAVERKGPRESHLSCFQRNFFFSTFAQSHKYSLLRFPLMQKYLWTHKKRGDLFTLGNDFALISAIPQKIIEPKLLFHYLKSSSWKKKSEAFKKRPFWEQRNKKDH